MYASLNDSYEWNQLNHKGALTTKVQDLLREGEKVGLDRIPTAMLQIKNRIKSILINQIADRINDGRIVMIYAPDIKVPVYLPFIITQTAPNTFTGIVFLNIADPEKPETANGEIMLNARKLKVSLESCFISLCISELGESPTLRSTAILRSGSKIYAGMLDKLFSLFQKNEDSTLNTLQSWSN